MSDANFQIKIGVETQLAQLKAMEAQFEKQIVQLRTLGTGGADALKKVESNLALVRAELVKTASASGATGAVAGGAFKNIGQTVGQAGYQMQDFAVQVAGGQSALTAFAQQGSQLLGIFGPTGIIAGAVLAVGALAIKMLNLGDNTEVATSKFKTQAEAVAALIKARRELIAINDPSAAKTFAVQDVNSDRAKYEAQMVKTNALKDSYNNAIEFRNSMKAAQSMGTKGRSRIDELYEQRDKAIFAGGKSDKTKDPMKSDSEIEDIREKYMAALKAATELKAALTEVQVVDEKIDKALVDAREANLDMLRTDAQRLEHLINLQKKAEEMGQQDTVEYEKRKGQIQALVAAEEAAAAKRQDEDEKDEAARKAKDKAEADADLNDALKSESESRKRTAQERDNALSSALAASQQRLAEIEADRFRTTAEKAPLRIAALQDENARIQERIKLLVEENKLSPDTTREGKIDQLRNQQAGNNVKIGSTQPLGVGDSLAAASTSYMNNIGTVADQVGRAWTSVGQSMSSSLGNAFSDMILKAQSFGQAMAGFGNAILQSMVQVCANMVAEWIISHTVMAAVRSMFHAKDVIETGATEVAKTSIKAGSEAAQTGVAIAGSSARVGVSVGEAATTGSAWSFAAIMASIGQLGPIAGPAVLLGAIVGLSAIISNMGKHADGGLISGPGTGRSDSIPAWLSNGEYVMPADKTAQYRPLLDSMRAGTLSPGQLAAAPATAGGGSPTLNSSVNMAFFDSRPSAEQWAKSTEGESHMIDVMQRNIHRITGTA